jgi:hypothetical protein
MAPLPEVAQQIQIAVEGTAGTYNTTPGAFRILDSWSVADRIMAPRTPFRPAGRRYSTVVPPNKEHVGAAVTGPLAYNDLVYEVSMLAGSVAPTQVGTLNAWDWVFTFRTSGLVTPTTVTVEHGSDGSQVRKYSYAHLTGLSLAVTPDDCTKSGDLAAQRVTVGTALTGAGTAATTVAMVPVIPDEWNVAVDTVAANVGNTVYSSDFAFDFGLTGMNAPYWRLRRPQQDGRPAGDGSYAGIINQAPAATSRLNLAWDAEGTALLNQLRSGAPLYIRADSLGGQIDGSANYMITIDEAVKLNEPGAWAPNQGAVANDWPLVVVNDATWGYAARVTVRCARSAL